MPFCRSVCLSANRYHGKTAEWIRMALGWSIAVVRKLSMMFPQCTAIVTSAKEGGYVFGAVCLSVCLSVCLFVCLSVGLLANL